MLVWVDQMIPTNWRSEIAMLVLVVWVKTEEAGELIVIKKVDIIDIMAS